MQAAFASHNRPKYRQREFAFGGLLTCAYDDCTVTAEIKKGKYIYYHCPGHRGKCDLPYFREDQLGDRMCQVLQNIHIPDEVLKQLIPALQADQLGEQHAREQQRGHLKERLVSVRRRVEQAYIDKLDGTISDKFWKSKNAEWHTEEAQILASLSSLNPFQDGQSALKATKILELANKAWFLYLRQSATERAKLLRIVLSNCRIDAANLYPTYRKPFDLISRRVKTKEWYAR